MRRRTRKLLLTAALLAGSATMAAGERPLHRGLREMPVEPRVVAPLADPALVPGVSRCTSDGICTVTDADGTRRGTRLAVTP